MVRKEPGLTNTLLPAAANGNGNGKANGKANGKPAGVSAEVGAGPPLAARWLPKGAALA